MAKIIAKTEITISRIVDIESVTRYYLLQSSTAAAPSKPTTNPPGGSWKTTEPSYVSGSTNTLYFSDCTVMTNGTFSYSAVSKNSSYEAAKEAWNKANNAQESIDNLEIGGRNLSYNTSSEWSEWWTPKPDAENVVSPTLLDVHIPYNLSIGDQYTVSIELEFSGIKPSSNIPEGKRFSIVSNIKVNDVWSIPAIVNWLHTRTPPEDGVVRITKTSNVRLENQLPIKKENHSLRIDWVSAGKVRWRLAKFEKGNKATDWTPAPEDVNSSIDDVIGSYQKDLLDQRTEILKEVDEIVLTAGADYVVKDDYSKYQETVESKFTQMEDGIKMDFSTSREQLNELNKALADTKTEWAKYIRFNEDGIEIGDTDNSLKLEIDNDMIRFTKNGVSTGWWDGNNFHTGNIVVEVNERAQFGNFAFVPRSDGSLSFLKVGD